ncbi:TetR/AcrR family transcriptional regulator [Frondihabitans cladoniiphilus]
MTGSTSKGEATRAEIVRAAAGVFAAKGYAATRMDDVFRAAGLSKGAVYFHFTSKADLARAVVAEQKQRWLALTTEAIAGGATATEQLASMGELLLKLMSSDSSAWNVVKLSAQLAAENDEVARTVAAENDPLRDWVSVVSGVIARGQSDGEFTGSATADDLAALVVGSFDGLKTVSDALDPADSRAFARRGALLVASMRSMLVAP